MYLYIAREHSVYPFLQFTSSKLMRSAFNQISRTPQTTIFPLLSPYDIELFILSEWPNGKKHVHCTLYIKMSFWQTLTMSRKFFFHSMNFK